MKEIAYKRIAEIRIRLASLICEQLNGSYKNEFIGKMVSILARTGIGNVYSLIYDYATKNPDNCDSIIALSKYDRPESLEFFKEKLKDHRSLHRDLIVECLGNYNKPELVNYIKTFLADEDRQVRFQAIYALYNIGGREAALAMCDYISDPDEWISMTILRLLCRMKVLDTIPILTEKYHADTDLRRKALMISFLSRFKSITLLEAFDDALQARDARLRANAIEAIGDLKLPEEELTKRIVPFLNDPNNRIRANAILAMAKITPEKVKAQIIEMCNSDDVQLRRSAAFILCMIPPDQFFKEAEKLIVDENDTVRKRMIQSLKNFPHQFISANINKVLSDENKWIRKYAVDMVAAIPAFESTPIVNILKSEQAAPNIEACLNFLVSHPSDNAMSSLKIHFKDQRLPVVKAMLKALLAIGGVEEVKKMAPRLEQRDPIVVQNITSTLLESGSLETLEEFLNRFQKIKTNNNMELVLPALESVVETICKGEKMPPKLLKALSDEPINQNAGFGSPRLQQFQPQQFARPQVPPFNQPMPPNMGVPPIPPQNQGNFGVSQQAVPNLQNLRTNSSIPQINQNSQENINVPQQVSNQDSNQNIVDTNNMAQQVEQIQNAEQNLDLNMDIPQQPDMGIQANEGFDLNLDMPQQADEDFALSFDISQQTEAEEQAGEDFSLKLDLPQIAEPISNGGLDNNIDAQNSYSNPLLNQNQLIDQQPSDQGAVQPTDQTIQSGQLFQELPPLTKTEIPVENQNNSNLGFNGLGFGVDNGSDNSSMMLPSFQELDTLNMPNAPEVSIAKKPSIPHYKAGLKAYNLGKYPKAIEEFNKSIANNESAPKAIDMYLGIMLLEKNEYDDAIPHFKAFIKNTPDNSKAHFLLGKCYRKNKDWQNLINTYQLFIEGELETTPKMKKRIYQDMGTACAILGKSETAVRLLTALYKLETDNAEIGYYLALALYKMKKTSEAAVIIDKAAKTAPKGKPLEKQITVLSQNIRAGIPVSE